MRRSRFAGLLLISMAALAQQQQPVEITAEPRHHLVFENQYVRVFDVTVEPRGTTLVHRHNYDYLFVTLGDSELISQRPGEPPVQLSLKDGETRFTPGNFSHAAINKSDRPFHNITIELLKPSTGIHNCPDGCPPPKGCIGGANHACATNEPHILSDQWSVSLVTLPPSTGLTSDEPRLVIAVSELDLTQQSGTAASAIKQPSGGLVWVPPGSKHTLTNLSTQSARFVTLEFTTEKPQ